MISVSPYDSEFGSKWSVFRGRNYQTGSKFLFSEWRVSDGCDCGGSCGGGCGWHLPDWLLYMDIAHCKCFQFEHLNSSLSLKSCKFYRLPKICTFFQIYALPFYASIDRKTLNSTHHAVCYMLGNFGLREDIKTSEYRLGLCEVAQSFQGSRLKLEYKAIFVRRK